jgi:hypothetical protein
MPPRSRHHATHWAVVNTELRRGSCGDVALPLSPTAATMTLPSSTPLTTPMGVLFEGPLDWIIKKKYMMKPLKRTLKTWGYRGREERRGGREGGRGEDLRVPSLPNRPTPID